MITEPTNIDLACVGCGYDVRQLDPAGQCPECGTSIARSLKGERLVDADPDWVARIVRGQRLAALGIVITSAGAAALLFATLTGRLIAEQLGLDWEGRLGAMVGAVLFFGPTCCGLLLACVGVVLVTSPDPRDREREARRSPRRVARWGMLAAAALIVAGEVDAFATSWVLALAAIAISIAGIAALALAMHALFFRLSELAWRIPAAKAAERAETVARAVRWQLLTFAALGLIHNAAFFVPRNHPLHDVAQIVSGVSSCGAAIIVILLLIGLLGMFATMVQLHRAFGELNAERTV